MTLGGLARYVSAFVVAGILSRGAPALADHRIDELTKTLASGSNEKTRLSAVLALAKIGDKTTLRPLVGALADPSSKVRTVAALALGKLAHKAALPALRTLAKEDPDDEVRRRAKDAAIAVASANQLADPFEPAGAHAIASAATKPTKPRPGFGNQPRALESRPDLYVVIKSSADDSPGKADKPTRKLHAAIVRQALAEHCRTAPNVTSAASDARRWGLDLRNVDLSVVKMDVLQTGGLIEVEAQLRLAISDEHGKMLSFVSGGAKVQVPKQTFDMRYLPTLRKEALENAMRGMFDKLLEHLRARPRGRV